jgi:alpha-1,2-mannosyltransferase
LNPVIELTKPRRSLAKALIARFHIIAWLFGIALSLLLFIRDFVTSQRAQDLSINGSAIWGRDFVNVFTSGRFVIEGRLADLYDKTAYRAWQTNEFGWGIHDHMYSYPPVTLLYTPAFGAIPYFWSLALWTIVSLLLFGLAARPWLAREKLHEALALILPTSIVCIWAGHYGLIMGALWLSAWHHLETRPKLSGLMTGLMIIKPHMAVLMPILYLRRKAWTAIATAAATVTVLVAISILLFGMDLWHTYLASTSQSQLNLLHATHTFFAKMMPTLSPALFAFGFPSQWVWPTQLAVAVTVIILMWQYQPADPHRAGLAAAVATFLILPYAFNYDMTVVGLASLILLTEASRAIKVWRALLASLIFLLPAVIIYMNKAGFWIAPLLIAAFLFQILHDVERAPRWGRA